MSGLAGGSTRRAAHAGTRAAEPPATDAELADALLIARELESLAAGDASVRPTASRTGSWPRSRWSRLPRLVVRRASAGRGGPIGTFLIAVGDAWRVATSGGRPTGSGPRLSPSSSSSLLPGRADDGQRGRRRGIPAAKWAGDPVDHAGSDGRADPRWTPPSHPNRPRPAIPRAVRDARGDGGPRRPDRPTEAAEAGRDREAGRDPRVTRTPRPTEAPEPEDTQAPATRPIRPGTDDHGGGGGGGSGARPGDSGRHGPTAAGRPPGTLSG